MKKPATPHGYWLFDGGDGEIRTHVPVRANAFRVRPVMTTSIRLRVYFNPLFFSPKNRSKNFWREKQERKQKIIRF